MIRSLHVEQRVSSEKEGRVFVCRFHFSGFCCTPSLSSESQALGHFGFLEFDYRGCSWGSVESVSFHGSLLFARKSQLVVRDCPLLLMCLRVSMSISVKEPSVPRVQMHRPLGWNLVDVTGSKQGTGIWLWLDGALPARSRKAWP